MSALISVKDTRSEDRGSIIELSDVMPSIGESRGVSYWLRGIQMQVQPDGSFARDGAAPFYRRVVPLLESKMYDTGNL